MCLYGGRTLLNVNCILVHPKYVFADLGAHITLLSDSVGCAANVRLVQLSSTSLEVTPGHQCWATG